MNLTPLRLKPVYVSRKWGNPALLADLHQDVTCAEIVTGTVGESWDISSYPEADCLMLNGPLAGQPLSALLALEGRAVLGRDWSSFNDFPLLQKFLAPKADLPLQVHPADDYARRIEKQNGKAECWYIIDCPAEAFVWLGLRDIKDKNALVRAIAKGALPEVMQKIPVRAGDVICIPPGLVHGLGASCLAYEIQQNSDVTYRLDDFGLGIDSEQAQQEHVRKALDVIDFEANLRIMEPAANWVKADGFIDFAPFFGFGSMRCAGEEKEMPRTGTALGLTVLSGAGQMCADRKIFNIEKGQSWLVPAALQECTLHGDFQMLYSIFPN